MRFQSVLKKEIDNSTSMSGNFMNLILPTEWAVEGL